MQSRGIVLDNATDFLSSTESTVSRSCLLFTCLIWAYSWPHTFDSVDGGLLNLNSKQHLTTSAFEDFFTCCLSPGRKQVFIVVLTRRTTKRRNRRLAIIESQFNSWEENRNNSSNHHTRSYISHHLESWSILSWVLVCVLRLDGFSTVSIGSLPITGSPGRFKSPKRIAKLFGSMSVPVSGHRPPNTLQQSVFFPSSESSLSWKATMDQHGHNQQAFEICMANSSITLWINFFQCQPLSADLNDLSLWSSFCTWNEAWKILKRLNPPHW